MSKAPEFSVSDEDLESARGYREGLEWWGQQLQLETAQPATPPSNTPISTRAFDLIVSFEVSGQQVYERRYKRPTWPRGRSGVTIGVGYDVGYATKRQLHTDWDVAIPADMVIALEQALGVTGEAAHQLASTLASVDIPWAAAIDVHRKRVVPRWVGIVEHNLPNTGALGPDCLGALVSLTYNRGASYSSAGDRYAEMRSIKAHMASSNFAAIPSDLRSMKRLWPDVRGLQDRRELEARLFEQGLAIA